MIGFVLRRAFAGVLVMLAVAAVSFVLFQFVGDPVSQMLPIDASPEDRRILAASLGLNEPGYVQFWHFLCNVDLVTDLGVTPDIDFSVIVNAHAECCTRGNLFYISF